MAYTVTKVDMWTGEIADSPGGLAAVLTPLADAGADLEVVIARRSRRGTGVVFLAPVKGAAVVKAAKSAGLKKAADLAALRVEGANKKGECSRMSQALADAGINMRGLAASVTGRKFTMYLGFDSAPDAGKAARILRSKKK